MRPIYPAILTATAATFIILACGGGAAAPAAKTGDFGSPAGVPMWRYVNSGWVSPLDEQNANAFLRELRAAIITDADELDQFNRTVVSKRTHGTGASLSRPEFPGSVVLAAYLMWLPVQGDPLSVVAMEVNGNRVVVELELEEDAQGREYPYLFAPMTMVTVDRSALPAEGPVEFEFRLDGESRITLTDTLE